MGKCISKKKTETAESPSQRGSQIHERYITRHQNIYDCYNVSKVIGFGGFGVVRKASSKTHSNLTVAIKTIDKTKISTEAELTSLKRELEILMEVDHPNIIKLYEAYEDEKFVHLVTEYCSGGELFEKIIQKGRFSELDASKVFLHMLRAVHHLHQCGICHRDLKPENFLFISEELGAELKLIDFGLSNKFKMLLTKMNTIVGTPNYVAPEILSGQGYDFKCDMWSLGVLLYVILSGGFPFSGPDRNAVFKAVIKGKYNFEGPEWERISSEAKDLIAQLIVLNPEDRLDGDQALSHPWFSLANPVETVKVDVSILDTLRNYKSQSKLKKEAMQVIVRYLSFNDIKDLKEVFVSLDTEKTGYLSHQEIKTALIQAGSELTQQELENILREIDYLGDGRVNYSEFLAATLSSKIKFNEDLIWSTFKVFDRDNTGFISAENISDTLNSRGKKLASKEIEDMIREVDLQIDGKVSFEEFKAMLLSNI